MRSFEDSLQKWFDAYWKSVVGTNCWEQNCRWQTEKEKYCWDLQKLAKRTLYMSIWAIVSKKFCLDITSGKGEEALITSSEGFFLESSIICFLSSLFADFVTFDFLSNNMLIPVMGVESYFLRSNITQWGENNKLWWYFAEAFFNRVLYI